MKAAMLIIKDDLTGVEIRALLETHFAGMLAMSTDVQAATESLTLNAHIPYYALTSPRSSFPRKRESNTRTFRILHDRVKTD
jgi:hypothetical protein